MTWAARLAGLSIRARLALWYSGSVLVVFLLFAGALRVTVRSALRTEFSSAVRSSSEAIRSFFRLEFGEYRDARATITHIANEVVFPDRIVEFVKADNSVAFRVGPDGQARRPGRDGGAPPATLPAPIREYTVALDTINAPGWTLRVFASAASLDRALALIDRWLIIGVPLGFLFAGAMGWMLAGRTLQPIGVMAAAAARMATDRSSARTGLPPDRIERLPIANPSDELGRLGTRFNALLDQVDHVLEQQRRFLADAAHELRTPVARMLGNIDLAALDPGDAHAQHNALSRVRSDVQRTSRLIDELLQLARADANGGIQPRTGYLDDIVLDAVNAWQPSADRQDIALNVVALEEAAVNVDAVHIERMIGILLDNAIRYTPAGGQVDVRVDVAATTATLSVADTGIGIAEFERSRIFERFYRGAHARSVSPDGSGLGLPIAQWIADAHDATLCLAQRQGGGTLATVRIRLAGAADQHLIVTAR